MAVSFKVPSSPKRSIFNIDNFLGVDLTNTGANIDEVRSPNAENMIRYVPGKVRKRTGYHTKVEFSNREDVNRALGTSDEWVEIDVHGVDYATADVIYNFAEEITSPDVFFEYDVSGSYIVAIECENEGLEIRWTLPGTDPRAFSFNRHPLSKAIRALIYRTSNNDDDYFKLRRFRICSNDDTSATTKEEWMDLEWSAAPEDKDIIFKREASNLTIWGCHTYRNGVFEGNRVIDQNRALNTSNSFQTFTCDDTGYTTIYDLGNFVYEVMHEQGGTYTFDGTELYFEFDYISDGEADVQLTGWSNPSYRIKNTNGNIAHYVRTGRFGSYSNRQIKIKAVSGTVNVQIKNLSVLYEKSPDYTWKPAPEDLGKTFALADVYNVGSSNHAARNSYEATITLSGTTGYIRADAIQTADTAVKGYCKVSFDVYAQVGNVSGIAVRLAADAAGGGGFLWDGRIDFDSNVNNHHVEFYTSSNGENRFVEAIYVDFTSTTSGAEASARITNIDVREISPKESYDISTKYYIYHAGSKFYLRAKNSKRVVEIFSGANQHLSQAWQLNEKLFILDGKNIYSYALGDESVSVLNTEGGYIPLVTISKRYNGGGTSYESLNMLQPGFYEQFVVLQEDNDQKAFQLSFGGLDETQTKVWLRDQFGNWNEKTEGIHYSVNRADGIITFVTAPGYIEALKGEDSIRVLAYRTVPGYADRVAKCTIGALFGVGGAADRIFLSGNPDYPNWDFYSQEYDPSYFPDTGYSALGTAASSIVGYAIVNNYLATFKDDFDSSQAVFIREGDMIVDSEKGTPEPAFKLINTLQGNGVVAPYSFGYLQTEPLFLTRSGIYAITAQDITGEKYSQNRSFYLDGKLRKEPNMENAVAAVFDDMYVLALNNQLYILDGLQATRTDRSEPYSTRQYVAFYCTNVPAVSIWNDEQALWIGTNDGRICRFATDIEDLESYNDDGQPIYCCWETPDLDGKLFYKNKTFRYIAIRMMKALRTSVAIFGQRRGNWNPTPLKEDRQSGLAFDFNNVDFALFSFSTDRSEKVVHSKIRIKKVDKARFRMENKYINEPFGLFDLALEYIEGGNYKG